MIDPSTPLESLGVVVGEPVSVGLAGGVLDGGGALVDGGGGGVVCLDFEGLAEDGLLPGLDDIPEFAVTGM